MDRDAFVSHDRGELVKELDGYWSFRPSALPRELPLPKRTSILLDEATGAVFRLGGVGRLLPNPYLPIGPHLRLEAVLSSRIEGTETDVAQLLRFEADESSEPGLVDDTQEVRNYVTAMEHGLARIDDGFPISVRLFREMHELLLSGARGKHRLPGQLRSSPVWIGGSSLDNAVFVPPPIEAMGPALTDLELFLHERELPLLIQLALAHYQFEVIHPFLDGNGRIGRLLIPLVLVNRDAISSPLLYLSAFFERNRGRYYDLLLSTSQTGDLIPWIEFFLTGVREQAEDSENRTVRIIEQQGQMRSGLLREGRPSSVLRLADLLFSRPVVTAAIVAEAIGVSLPTANAAISGLVDRGDLREVTGRGRGRIYEASQIFEAVYGEVPASPDTR